MPYIPTEPVESSRGRAKRFSADTPLQALLIAPDLELRQRILDGRKRTTIREGWRNYRPGPVMLCCHLEPWCVWAEISDVRMCLLCNVTDDEIASEGVSDYEGLKTLLQRFYQDINDNSPVTIIRFGGLKGKLADRPCSACGYLPSQHVGRGECP